MIYLNQTVWPFLQRPRFFLSVIVFVVIIAFISASSLLFLSKQDTSAAFLSTFDPDRRPLAFVPNTGQNDQIVHYQTRIPGGNIFFTTHGLTLSWTEGETEQGSGRLDLNFVGASPDLVVTGEEAQLGVVNYMLGNDPTQWQTALPTYGLVRYEALYSGISLTYQGQGSNLTAVFQLEAGSDPTQISWLATGATPILDETGALKLASGETTLTLSPPQAWQEIDGRTVPVTATFRLDENDLVGLVFGDYDGDRPLAVGTVQEFNPSSAGYYDSIHDLVVGPDGSIYLTGFTQNPMFPSAIPYQAEYGGGLSDTFITVFSPDGQSLVYSTYLGGDLEDYPTSITLDNNGRIYVAGYTFSTDFPMSNPLQTVLNGGQDAFITVFAADGQSLDFSTYLGGSAWEDANQIALDSSGKVYVVGETSSEDFPLVNPFQATIGGDPYDSDAFVTAIDPNGWSLVYSTYLGGNSYDHARSVAFDDNGRVFLTGGTKSSNFPLVNPFQATIGSDGDDDDAFVTVFAPDGQSLDYSTYLGGISSDHAESLALDDNGQIYLTGYTLSEDFPLFNPLEPTSSGLPDAFVSVLTSDGQSMVYSTYLGGYNYEANSKIALDDINRVYVVGFTLSSDFPLVNPFQSTYAGSGDGYLAILAPDGQSLNYSTFLGGSDGENHLSIALDGSGRIYVAGSTESLDFPLANPFQSTHGGADDGFLTIFAPDGQSLDFSTYLHGDDEPTSVGMVNFVGVEPETAGWIWLVGGLLLVGIWIIRRRLNRL